MTNEEQPPTEEESRLYAIEKTLDDIHMTLDRIIASANEAMLELDRLDDEAKLEKRPGVGTVNIILFWLVLVFALAAVYKASSQANPVTRCANDIVQMVNPRLMGPTAAAREARVACESIRRRQPQLFKGMTQ